MTEVSLPIEPALVTDTVVTVETVVPDLTMVADQAGRSVVRTMFDVVEVGEGADPVLDNPVETKTPRRRLQLNTPAAADTTTSTSKAPRRRLELNPPVATQLAPAEVITPGAGRLRLSTLPLDTAPASSPAVAKEGRLRLALSPSVAAQSAPAGEAPKSEEEGEVMSAREELDTVKFSDGRIAGIIDTVGAEVDIFNRTRSYLNATDPLACILVDIISSDDRQVARVAIGYGGRVVVNRKTPKGMELSGFSLTDVAEPIKIGGALNLSGYTGGPDERIESVVFDLGKVDPSFDASGLWPHPSQFDSYTSILRQVPGDVITQQRIYLDESGVISSVPQTSGGSSVGS